MKVLVICDETIGDVVFATPVIRALKVQLDDVEVHGLFSPWSVFVTAENPYMDKIYTMKESVLRTWHLLKAEKYNVVIRLRTDVRSKILAILLRTKVYSLKPTGWEEWLMVRLKINRLVNIHLVDRLMAVLKPLSVRTDELGLDFFIPEKDKILLNWLPEIFQKGYVVLVLTTSYTTRRLPADRLIELCDKINKPIILLGNKEDAQDGEAVSNFFAKNEDTEWDEGLQKLGKSRLVYNACGKFNFNQMASIIKQSRAVFTFDSDFIPVASALRKEIYCLWGNTILLFGRYPYRTRFTVLESDKASCRPCSTRGFDSCPKGHFRCMNTILFDFYLP